MSNQNSLIELNDFKNPSVQTLIIFLIYCDFDLSFNFWINFLGTFVYLEKISDILIWIKEYYLKRILTCSYLSEISSLTFLLQIWFLNVCCYRLYEELKEYFWVQNHNAFILKVILRIMHKEYWISFPRYQLNCNQQMPIWLS